jgi:hypothetical protein
MRTRTFAVLALALLVGCAGRSRSEPEPPPPSFDPAASVGLPKEKTEEQMRAEATQTISFEEDADAGPTEEIKSPPKRKKIPRFRLFGEGPAPSE